MSTETPETPVTPQKTGIFSQRTLGLLAGVVSGMLWGLDTVFLNESYNYEPMTGNWTTMTTGAVSTMLHDMFSCAFVLLTCIGLGLFKEMKDAFSTRGLFWMALASLFGAPIGMLGYLLAIDNLGASYTSAISALYPALGGFLTWLFLKDKLFAVGWVGLGLAVIGTIGTSLAAIFAGGDEVSNAGIGIVFALMCVVGWGTECVIADYSFRFYTMNSTVALFIRQLVSVLVYNIFVLPINGDASYDLIREIFHTECIGWVIGASVCGTISYLCYYYAINALGATQAIALNITYAVWTIIFSLCFKIYPNYVWLIIICIVLICIGSFMCSGLGKEPYPWVLLKSWVDMATPEELDAMNKAKAAPVPEAAPTALATAVAEGQGKDSEGTTPKADSLEVCSVEAVELGQMA